MTKLSFTKKIDQTRNTLQVFTQPSSTEQATHSVKYDYMSIDIIPIGAIFPLRAFEKIAFLSFFTQPHQFWLYEPPFAIFQVSLTLFLSSLKSYQTYVPFRVSEQKLERYIFADNALTTDNFDLCCSLFFYMFWF